MHNRNGNMTYGLGAITDKTKKITVQVKQFVESNLEVGDPVKIKGSVTGQGFIFILVNNLIYYFFQWFNYQW